MEKAKRINKLEQELKDYLSVKKDFLYEYITMIEPFFANLERIKDSHNSEQWTIDADEVLRSHKTFIALVEGFEKLDKEEVERIANEIRLLN